MPNRNCQRVNHSLGLVSLALAALFLASFFGSALHHHEGASDHGCLICHFNHAPAVATATHLPPQEFVVIAWTLRLPPISALPDTIAHHTSYRAPPAV
jgi:hypothetical protein